MRIVLLSEGFELPALFTRANEIVRVTSSSTTIPDADLYIWDYEAGVDVRTGVLARPTAQHLVLVEAKCADAVTALNNFANILLKPVSVFTLNTFIGLAAQTLEMPRQSREAEALRSDRDVLFQYVLEANLRLQKYDQERNTFLARVLHDLQSPLTALHGYCGLLADEKLGPINPQQHELLDRMCYSANRLTRLAKGTLDLLLQARFETRTEMREGDLSDTLQRAIADVHPLIEDKNLDLEVKLGTIANATLLFDPGQIQQVFVNLLENSCKLTPKHGHIRVCGYPAYRSGGDDPNVVHDLKPSGAALGNVYRLDISDSGPGVPANLSTSIFEEYASYADSCDRSGGGLGLAICRAIITSHGGAIWSTPGDGGKFSFTLPMIPCSIQTAENDPIEFLEVRETADLR